MPSASSAPSPPDAGSDRERRIIFLIGAVQFINVLDFVMVMPLGPDFARALGIPASHLGIVGGSYTAAAAIAGVIGSLFLDRFDRRKALGYTLLGLVLGTALGGLAWDLPSLIAARVVAGSFGGPATSIAGAIIADAVPPERRGRAMGAVMGAFSVASVFGIPLGLELARLGGWQLPFFAVAALGLVVTALALRLMPPMTSHLAQPIPRAQTPLTLLRRPVVLLSLTGGGCLMFANFALIPNLSAYFQFNLGYPRAQLGLLYLCGGTISFLTMRLAGKTADRIGPTRTAALGTMAYVVVLLGGFVHPLAGLPVLVLFVCFMVTSSFRMVAVQTLTTRVPAARERARFMSLQSCVQHLASAAGAMFASQLLITRSDGGLVGMDSVATVSALLAASVPVLMGLIEPRVQQRESTERSAQALQRDSVPV
ncbi:MAG TPA: MFS transporter [Polyangiales bacterium]